MEETPAERTEGTTPTEAEKESANATEEMGLAMEVDEEAGPGGDRQPPAREALVHPSLGAEEEEEEEEGAAGVPLEEEAGALDAETVARVRQELEEGLRERAAGEQKALSPAEVGAVGPGGMQEAVALGEWAGWAGKRELIRRGCYLCPDQAYAAWLKFSSVTATLAQSLCEQLRLVLEASLASKLQGDFRTGKRLNMRKIIPYVFALSTSGSASLAPRGLRTGGWSGRGNRVTLVRAWRRAVDFSRARL